MSLRRLGPMCAVLLMGAAGLWAQEQLPSTPQPQPSAGQRSPSPTTSTPKPPAQEQQSSEDSPQTQAPAKPPSRLKRALKRAAPNCINIAGNQSCKNSDSSDAEQSPGDQREQKDRKAQARVPANQSPPRSSGPAGQSSSRDTRIDLSPPADDMKHEGADVTGVTELNAYDPHKAAKNVEVGDYYFKRKNYRAAESRYEEALVWKPNDAVALFRLAEAQEQLGKKTDAAKNYQAYLKILPEGEFAPEAKSGLERVKK